MFFLGTFLRFLMLGRIATDEQQRHTATRDGKRGILPKQREDTLRGKDNLSKRPARPVPG